MMLNRNDCAFIGYGHGGSKLVDNMMTVDGRYIGYFINTSIHDIQALDNYDEITKNYYHIPQADGAGRDRNVGKRYAKKNGWNIIDILKRFDQKVLYFSFSLGGGSGSSLVSAVLKVIDMLKVDPDEDFDKIINIIGILPRLDSSTQILQNTVDTWNEIMQYNCITNMYFIDNNNTFDGMYLEEEDINEYFVRLFDALYEIPTASKEVFDGSDLGKLLTSKGCSYIYELPEGYKNANKALEYAYNHSVLAKMYKTDDNIIEDEEDGTKKIKCEFLGTSFSEEQYKHEDVLKSYKPIVDDFKGENEERNLVLISGCLPPFYSIQVIMAELEDRKRTQIESKPLDNFGKFTIDTGSVESKSIETVSKPSSSSKKSKNQNMKKTMKKNFFDFI